MSTMQGEAMGMGMDMEGTRANFLSALMPFKSTSDNAPAATPSPEELPAARGSISWPSGCDEPRARPRIVFLVMSAVARADTIDQLAQALAPHLVLVHHDFSQTPHFTLSAANVHFVPNPKRTGWAQFGFVEGIFHSLHYATQHLDFDYLQLLSPSCLPIKPLHEFERHISGLEEAHFDCMDLLANPDAMRCVGYRAWTAADSLTHRLMRRLSDIHFSDSPGRRDEAGVWIRTGTGQGLAPQLAGLALDTLSHPLVGRHLREQPLRLYYGSTWFGARRHIVAGLVRLWQQPGVRQHFSQVRIAEEFLVPSLLMKLRAHKGPMNHLIQRFEQAHPGYFGVEHLPQLRASSAYFARKFADDPLAPVRLRVLQELVHSTAHAPAVPAAGTAALA